MMRIEARFQAILRENPPAYYQNRMGPAVEMDKGYFDLLPKSAREALTGIPEKRRKTSKIN